MTPIDQIPTDELLDDLAAASADIGVCSTAIAVGVTHHRDGMPVQERIDGNRHQIRVITAELARRREMIG